MAFLSPAVLPSRSPQASSSSCARRPVRAQASKPPSNDPLPNASPTPKIQPQKLTRSEPGVDVAPLSSPPDDEIFAEAYPGEAGGVAVGTGLGPKPSGSTETGEKRVSRASKAQGSMSFADAWASQNRDRGGSRIDIWAVIGLLFILTPPVIIGVAIYTGAIPGFKF